MSDVRICLVGASGLIGSQVIDAATGRSNMHLVAVARSELVLPKAARMEVLLGPTGQWGELIAAAQAQVLVCALGTTMARAGSPEAFRAVDHDLVLDVARKARSAGIAHLVLVSSVGASAMSRNFYLRVKGETEVALRTLGFTRLDILQPGLLLGRRQEQRPLERLGQLVAPLAGALALHGKWRRFRAIRGATVARTILALSAEKAPGAFVHEYDALNRAAQRLGE